MSLKEMEMSTTELIKELRKNAHICRDMGVMVTVASLMTEAAGRLEHLTMEIDIPSDYPKISGEYNGLKELIDNHIEELREKHGLPKM